MSRIVSYTRSDGIISQALVLTHYSIYEVHNIIDDSMSESYKKVKESLPTDYDSDGVEEMKESPSYIIENQRTSYTSYYSHHTFIVSIFRNADQNLEMIAIIQPNRKEVTHETQLEKEVIQEIAFVRLIKRIQYHAKDMQNIEDKSVGKVVSKIWGVDRT